MLVPASTSAWLNDPAVTFPSMGAVTSHQNISNHASAKDLALPGFISVSRPAESASSVEALRSIPTRPPDCVLMDIMMPELDGHELCRRLRAMPELAGTKLVMMSAK